MKRMRRELYNTPRNIKRHKILASAYLAAFSIYGVLHNNKRAAICILSRLIRAS